MNVSTISCLVLCRSPWPAQLISPVQAAAAHPHFISDTTFSSPTNVTTVKYVNGTTVLVYSSASASTCWQMTILDCRSLK